MRYYTLVLALCCAVGVTAQPVDNFNKGSLEGAFALHIPLEPMGAGDAADYTGLESFSLGYRHMFNQKWGMKLQYAYDAFRGEEPETGVIYNRVTLSGVYNLGRDILPLRRRVGLLTQVGIGYARVSPVRNLSDENTATINFGLTPQFRLAERVAIFLDASYFINLKQHYDFTGTLIPGAPDGDTGAFATVSLGIMVYLGSNAVHADWY